MINWNYFKIKLSFISGSVILVGLITYFNFFPRLKYTFYEWLFFNTSFEGQIESSVQFMPKEQQTLAVVLFVVILMLLWGYFGWKKGLIISMIFGFVLMVGAFIMFHEHSYLIPIFYWLLGIVVASGMSVLMLLQMQRADKDLLELALGAYVSPELREEVLRNPQKLALHGEKKKITVMFLDIHNFTQYSEAHDPKKVVSKLNDILGSITEVVQQHGGTVDKYLGDGAMAVWGAPAQDHYQTTKACSAALEIQRRLGSISVNGETEKPSDILSIGIGIHFGSAIVGNIGSQKHLDYTAIGDVVNTASRVENMTRERDPNILVTTGVKEKVAAEQVALEESKQFSFAFKRVLAAKVKGKKDKITLWALS